MSSHTMDDTRAGGSPHRELLAGGALILLFFGGFLGWAAIAPLDAGSFASGQVAVSGNRQAVQHREGGTVSRLLVAEGDRVEQGQVVLELATGELVATEQSLSAQIFALLSQRARLETERSGAGAIPTPAEFAGLRDQDLQVARESLRLQQQQFVARKANRFTERNVLRQRLAQLLDQVEGLDRQAMANTEQQRLISEELTGVRQLARQGYAPQTRVRALERTAAALDGELGSLRAQTAAAGEQIGQTRLQMLGIETKLNEDVSEQLRQVESQLNELKPKLVAVRDEIERSRVRSPVSGAVMGLSIFTSGGVVQPGQLLMEIVPDNASQIIVANINANDIDSVHVGLRTEVKFPGLHDRSLPTLHGQVTRLSADSFTDQASRRSFYRAEVIVPQSEMAGLGATAKEIRPGMPAEVVVLLKKRTALAYLIEPLVKSLWRAGTEQ